jgi:hypothetical protein
MGVDSMNLWSVAMVVFLLNVPFGYWRGNTIKFSRQWLLSIHIPVPVVIALRIFAGVGWYFITFPVLIGAFFLGQLVGGKLHVWFARYARTRVSSCLFWDLLKIANLLRSNNGEARQRVFK